MKSVSGSGSGGPRPADCPARATTLAEFWHRRAMAVRAAAEAAHRPINFHDRVVCKYWLKGRCSMEELCSWLHVMDHRKIPVCGYAVLRQPCPDGDQCVYRHE